MKKLIGITASIILTMAAFTSCGAESGTVSTDGSTSMEKVVGALGEAFMEDNKNITFTYNPTGSGSGITAVAEGRCDIGLSSRSLKDEEKAIVSDVHGTTRDVIEDTTIIDGITFRFIDTAGIRKTDDVVENIGIERTFQKMDEAKIVILVTDPNTPEDEVDDMMSKIGNKKFILVYNKEDDLLDPDYRRKTLFNTNFINGETDFLDMQQVWISAKYNINIDLLEQALVKAADIPEITENDVIITSARHYEALSRANASLARVLESMDMGMSGDIIAEDLKIVLEELGEITGGQISSQETLNNIFKHFCIGK